MGQAQAHNGYMGLYATPNPYAPATPYGPAQPAAQPQIPFIPPTAMLETPPGQAQSLQNKSRPKHSYRAANTPLPLKSALKKPGAAGATPGPAGPSALPEGSQPRRSKNSRVKPDKRTAVAPPDQMQTADSSDKGEACSSYFLPSTACVILNRRLVHLLLHLKAIVNCYWKILLTMLDKKLRERSSLFGRTVPNHKFAVLTG